MSLLQSKKELAGEIRSATRQKPGNFFFSRFTYQGRKLAAAPPKISDKILSEPGRLAELEPWYTSTLLA